jgi:hypothetical protein
VEGDKPLTTAIPRKYQKRTDIPILLPENAAIEVTIKISVL